MSTTTRAPLAMGVAVAVAMILATLSLSPLTADRSYWLITTLVILVIEGLSVGGRRLRLAPWVIHLVQLLVMLAVGLGVGLSAARSLGLDGSWASQLWQLILDSSVVVQTQPAPLPVHAGVRWLTVMLIGVVTILADILALSLESPVWVIAPLLTIYVIPALAAERSTPWWSFALIGVGYLVVLVTEQWVNSRRWTRNLAADTGSSRGPGDASGALAGLGAALAVPIVVLALLLGSALPGFGSLSIDSARPRGSGPMQLTDPTIDLQQSLADQSDAVLLTYRTSSRTGDYLRLASLTRVDSSGWHLAATNLTTSAPTAVPGLYNSSVTRTVQINIRDFGSEFLPAPYAPVSTTAGGQWSWDPQNLTIISTAEDREDATRKLSYSVTSQLPDPDVDTFGASAAGVPADKTTTTVPDDVPQTIINLAHQITASATTPTQRATAIQDYLRDPRRFTYSTTAPPGDGFEVLTNFLTRNRSGYCIHFAAAMALMARIEGIPSRVSIGFLPGTEQNGVWQVRGTNMHAWPELYFQGYGWVRYEPTAAVAESPAWSVENPNSQQQTTASASASAEPSVEPSASAAPSTSRPSTNSSVSAEPASPAAGNPFPWRTVLTWAGIAVLIVAVICTPMLVRLARRRSRLRATDPSVLVAGSWREIHDSWTDHGLRWPGGSPRGQFEAAGQELPDDARAALRRLSMAEERARYARTLGEVGDVVGDVETIRAALAGQDTPRPDWLATWLPASLWRS